MIRSTPICYEHVDLAGIDVAARYRFDVIATLGFHGCS